MCEDVYLEPCGNGAVEPRTSCRRGTPCASETDEKPHETDRSPGLPHAHSKGVDAGSVRQMVTCIGKCSRFLKIVQHPSQEEAHGAAVSPSLHSRTLPSRMPFSFHLHYMSREALPGLEHRNIVRR